MASIYEIDDYVPLNTYAKNEIAAGASTQAGTTLGRFYYNLGYDSGDGNLNRIRPESTGGDAYWGGYTTYNNATIPHFFWVPDYGTSVSSEPKVEVIQFGDGYEQRAPQNISADLLKVDVSFDNRDEKEVTAMAHFLHTRGAKDAFAFTPPSPYGSMKKFVCRSWDVNMNFHNNFSLKASFEEVVS